MRNGHSAPEIFSTSFLDLISCALAGVIILWVLTLNETNTSAAVPSRTAFFIQLAQRGYNHFQAVHITSGGGTFTFFVGRSPEKTDHTLPNGTRLTILNRPEDKSGGDLSFAASAIVSIEEISEELTLDFEVEKCPNAEDLHFVQLNVYSQRGLLQRRYLYQEKPRIKSMLDAVTAGIKKKKGAADAWVLNGDGFSLPIANFRWLKQTSAGQVEPPITLDTSLPARWALTVEADGSFSVQEPRLAQGDERNNATLLVDGARRRLEMP